MVNRRKKFLFNQFFKINDHVDKISSSKISKDENHVAENESFKNTFTKPPLQGDSLLDTQTRKVKNTPVVTIETQSMSIVKPDYG